MKKLILIAGLCFLAIQNSNAMDAWVTCRTGGGPSGSSYERVTTGSYANGSGGTTYTMDCEGSGSNCCDWLVVFDNFTEANVNQAVAAQIANNNLSGQKYKDGSSGNYTIATIYNDQSGKPCYLWEVSYNQNNDQVVTILIFDGNIN